MDLPPTSEQSDVAVIGHELVIVTASSVQAEPWPAGGELVVGRAPEAQVRLHGKAVSRLHAVFRHDADGFSVEDLGSANGCLLGGTRIAARTRVRIQPGDAVHVGEHVLLVRAIRAGDGPVAAGPPGDAAPVIVSAVMRRIYALTDPIAASQLNVLVLGETGVGKDVFAHSVHDRSPRRSRPFVRLNCAALTEPLLESELFGHQRGAFTGAIADKPGLLETAAGGTVFLDEVGELSAGIQAKLLHVIETREVQRVGSVRAQQIDVRFIAATNRNLEANASVGQFRSDLYYRLAGFTVVIPPLRDRRDEILPLATELVRRAARAGGQPPAPITAEAAAVLMAQSWPGNVRELRNTIERAAVLAQGGPIAAHHLPIPAEPAADEVSTEATADLPFDLSPAELAERDRLIHALRAASGNQSHAARALGVSRSTLLNRLDALRIARPRKRPQF